MRVIITGGNGFLGRLLAKRLVEIGKLIDSEGNPTPLTEIVRCDAVAGASIEGTLERVAPIEDPESLDNLVGDHSSVFHLASIVSSAGERDYGLAMLVNLEGTRNVIDAARRQTGVKLVFASSIAVFGDAPDEVSDSTKQTSSTTYGITKTIGELLVNDATRRGFIDGRSARLPHVIIRPGAPNAAASGFASAVFREPLAGIDYSLPVTPDTVMPVLGYRAVIEGIVRLHDAPSEAIGSDRAVGLPAIPASVNEMIAALHRVAGSQRLGEISLAPDPFIQTIVDGWPRAVDARRAIELGLPVSESLDAIVAEYVQDFGTELS